MEPARRVDRDTTEEHQALLLLTYRDPLDQRAISQTTGISLRAIAYITPDARQALAATLDRLQDLL